MPVNIGPLEIGIVLVIALVVFGPRRLPELGGSMGRGIREFTKSLSGDSEKKALPKGDGAGEAASAPPVAEAAGATAQSPGTAS
jgi:sec-independent protein translocase protein TatA